MFALEERCYLVKDSAATSIVWIFVLTGTGQRSVKGFVVTGCAPKPTMLCVETNGLTTKTPRAVNGASD